MLSGSQGLLKTHRSLFPHYVLLPQRNAVSSVQFSRSVASDSLRPMDCSTPGFPVHLPELTQTHVHRIGDAIQPSHPLSLLFLPSIFPSNRVFSNESVLHIRQPKYWSFSFSIRLCKEYSGLISFRIDWLDLLAVQGTLKNLLQQHQFFGSQLQECLNPTYFGISCPPLRDSDSASTFHILLQTPTGTLPYFLPVSVQMSLPQ